MLQVPLVIYQGRQDNAASGRRVRRQVRLIDVAPTILDLVGLPIPDPMEGVSLAANVVDAEGGPVEDLEAFSQVGRNGAARDRDLIAVTTSEFKYILDFEGGAEELYELRVDPAETRNLAAQNPTLLKDFKDKVLSFRAAQIGKRIEAVPGAEIDEELEEQLRALGYIQ